MVNQVSKLYEIRAVFDKETILLWQAYGEKIAEAALAKQKFVEPFSFNRMTWLKPSFTWMMHRSNWGRKKGQERTLAVRITRSGWEKALALAVLTSPNKKVHPSRSQWEKDFKAAKVHVQWDTERTLRGAPMNLYSIQVGISRHLIQEYVDEWIVAIEDFTPQVKKIKNLIQSGKQTQAKRLILQEKTYPLLSKTQQRLGMT